MSFDVRDIDLIYLRKEIALRFNLEEIKTLCFDLKIDNENIAGPTRESKARELVEYCYRRDMLADLVKMCQTSWPRPSINEWTNSVNVMDISDATENFPQDAFQNLFVLIRAFNRNRNQPFSNQRTMEGDNIAFTIREIIPQIFNKFDVYSWIRSANPGKRLAAIKHIEWIQDIDFLEILISRLTMERPFLQFHILLAINNFTDQLTPEQCLVLKRELNKYDTKNDANNSFWQRRILTKLP